MRHGSGDADGFGPADFALGVVINAFMVNVALDRGPQEAGLRTAAMIQDGNHTDEQIRGILAAVMASSSPLLGGGDRVQYGGAVPDPEAAAHAQTMIQNLYGEDRLGWIANLALDGMFWRSLGYALVAIVGAILYYADTESDELPEGVQVFPMPEDES